MEEILPYCKECGKEMGEDAKFCPECGTAVSQTVPRESREKEKSGRKPTPAPSISLEEDEELLWSDHPSRLGHIGAYLGALFLGLIFGVLAGLFGGAGAGLFVFFLIVSILFYIFEKGIAATTYYVTDKRAIKEVDWFGRSVESTDLYNATDVSFKQGWLQKMVDYGNVQILTPGTTGSSHFAFITSGGGGITIAAIRQPVKVSKIVSEAISDLKEERDG